MEDTPSKETLARLFLNRLWVFFSILKEDTTGPPFLPSPQPHPVFRENELEGKTKDRKLFPKLGRAPRLRLPPHPHPTCQPVPPLSDNLPILPHAWHLIRVLGFGPVPLCCIRSTPPVQESSGASSHRHMVPSQVPSWALSPARAPLTFPMSPAGWGRGKRRPQPPVFVPPGPPPTPCAHRPAGTRR